MKTCVFCGCDLASPAEEFGPVREPLCRSCFLSGKAIEAEQDEDAERLEEIDEEIDELEAEIDELEGRVYELKGERKKIEAKRRHDDQEKKARLNAWVSMV